MNIKIMTNIAFYFDYHNILAYEEVTSGGVTECMKKPACAVVEYETST